jgi:hypothetical protein
MRPSGLFQRPVKVVVRPDWADAVRRVLPDAVEVEPRAFLGGVILVDLGHGGSVDGSWDSRLADLEAELWTRWRRDVGADR